MGNTKTCEIKVTLVPLLQRTSPKHLTTCC